MKAACGTAHMKAILATGELGSLKNVYKASMVCMMAGTFHRQADVWNLDKSKYLKGMN